MTVSALCIKIIYTGFCDLIVAIYNFSKWVFENTTCQNLEIWITFRFVKNKNGIKIKFVEQKYFVN